MARTQQPCCRNSCDAIVMSLLWVLMQRSFYYSSLKACSRVQGVLECVEGLSLVGLPSPVNCEALGRMPNLRILIMDGVDVKSPLTGFELPHLAMLSWRNHASEELPLNCDTVRNAAVLDLQGCSNLTSLPDGIEVRHLQARMPCLGAALLDICCNAEFLDMQWGEQPEHSLR